MTNLFCLALKRSGTLAGACLLVASCLSVSYAATRYVAINGNDSTGNGSIGSPYATVQKALTVTGPGDVVQLRGGTYYPNAPLWIGNSGNNSAWIKIHSYPGEWAVINGQNMAKNSNNHLWGVGGQYVEVSNLELQNSPSIGLQIWDTANVRVSGCIVRNSWGSGIWAGNLNNTTRVTNITVQNCTITENSQLSATHQPGVIQAGALMTYGAGNCTFKNNTVTKNHGEGLILLLANNCVAQENKVSDNYNVNMYLDNATYCTFQNNLVYTTRDTRFFSGGYPAVGIQIANEDEYNFTNISSNNTIINNMVKGGRFCFQYGNYELGGGLRNTKIANNTFVQGDSCVLFIDPDNGHTNTSIVNNIFWQDNNKQLGLYGGSYYFTLANNCWWGGNWNNGGLSGTNDVWLDPKLANPYGTTANDFRLTSGSGCTDRGWNGQVSFDYFWQSRTGTMDIGAHRFN